MQIKRRMALVAAGLLGVAGLGTGVAIAQSTTAPAPPAASATSPDNTEPSGTEVEGVEQAEANEADLPGGGHADAPDQNVDHQFEGVE